MSRLYWGQGGCVVVNIETVDYLEVAKKEVDKR